MDTNDYNDYNPNQFKAEEGAQMIIPSCCKPQIPQSIWLEDIYRHKLCPVKVTQFLCPQLLLLVVRSLRFLQIQYLHINVLYHYRFMC